MNRLKLALASAIFALGVAGETSAQVKTLPLPNQPASPSTPDLKPIAGRVMTVDRTKGTFTIHPYGSGPGAGNDVKVTVNDKTTFEWSPAVKDAQAPTLGNVKRGSWVRVQYTGDVAKTVFIHVRSQPTTQLPRPR